MYDEKELLARLWEIVKEDPQSIREYTRRIGFSEQGGGTTLRSFLYQKRKTSFSTMLKVNKFLEDYKK